MQPSYRYNLPDSRALENLAIECMLYCTRYMHASLVLPAVRLSVCLLGACKMGELFAGKYITTGAVQCTV